MKKEINLVMSIDVNENGNIINHDFLEYQEWIQTDYIDEAEIDDMCQSILADKENYNKMIIAVFKAESVDTGTYFEPDYETVFTLVDYYIIEDDLTNVYGRPVDIEENN
jgi:hypothetical protein